MLVTRPLSPPWDEASKNFAYQLARKIKGVELTILVNEYLDSVPSNVEQLQVYTSNNLSFFQKLRLLKIKNISEQFDVIHYLFTPTPLNRWFFKVVLEKKHPRVIQTVTTVRDDLYSKDKLKSALKADTVVVYSEESAKKLKALGVNNLRVIPPGIDFETFKPRPKNTGLLKKLGLKENDFIVTFPGEYTRLGATDTLFEAIPEIIESIPNLKFIFANRIKFAADKTKKESLKKRSIELGLENHILFIDTMSDMAGLFNLSDVVLFSVSNMSGKFDVPLSIIEAMACAKPVILSDLPALNRLAEASGSPVVPALNSSKLAAAITRLYQDAENRNEIGKRASEFVRQNFDINVAAEAYGQLYQEVLSENE